jgi:hypothetical protein
LNLIDQEELLTTMRGEGSCAEAGYSCPLLSAVGAAHDLPASDVSPAAVTAAAVTVLKVSVNVAVAPTPTLLAVVFPVLVVSLPTSTSLTSMREVLISELSSNNSNSPNFSSSIMDSIERKGGRTNSPLQSLLLLLLPLPVPGPAGRKMPLSFSPAVESVESEVIGGSGLLLVVLVQLLSKLILPAVGT